MKYAAAYEGFILFHIAKQYFIMVYIGEHYMSIYYFLIEAVPMKSNPESETIGGGYINCWVKADSTKDAIKKAKEYVRWEKWKWLNAEDMYTVEREEYVDDPESLESYDIACEYGVGANLYTWAIDEE